MVLWCTNRSSQSCVSNNELNYSYSYIYVLQKKLFAPTPMSNIEMLICKMFLPVASLLTVLRKLVFVFIWSNSSQTCKFVVLTSRFPGYSSSISPSSTNDRTCGIMKSVVVLQMRDTEPSGWTTSPKACQGSMCAEPATPPAPTAAPLTWRLSPVRMRPHRNSWHDMASASLSVSTVCDLFPQPPMQAWWWELLWDRFWDWWPSCSSSSSYWGGDGTVRKSWPTKSSETLAQHKWNDKIQVLLERPFGFTFPLMCSV